MPTDKMELMALADIRSDRAYRLWGAFTICPKRIKRVIRLHRQAEEGRSQARALAAQEKGEG